MLALTSDVTLTLSTKAARYLEKSRKTTILGRVMGKRRTSDQSPLPEVFVSTRETSRLVSTAVAAGKARKLAARLYTSNMVDAPDAIIRRNLWRVVSLVVPGTVVSHRTAIEMRPA